MSKQTSSEDLTLRAKLLRRQNQAKQMKEVNRRRIASGRGPTIIARLKAVDAYKKLILYTEMKESMEALLMLDEKYYKEDGRSPIWVATQGPDQDGIHVRVSVPKFMQNKLFKYAGWVGQDVNIALAHKSYDSEEYGRGWYLALNGELQLMR